MESIRVVHDVDDGEVITDMYIVEGVTVRSGICTVCGHVGVLTVLRVVV